MNSFFLNVFSAGDRNSAARVRKVSDSEQSRQTGQRQIQQKQFVKRIRDKSAVVAIIGMGYVGLPLMLRFSETGFRVIGLTIINGRKRKPDSPNMEGR